MVLAPARTPCLQRPVGLGSDEPGQRLASVLGGARGLVRRGRVILAQSYLGPADLRARGFVLGSYLLVKGTHTFLNMDIGAEAQWLPEYAVELGRALTPPPSGIEALRVAGGLYVRRYARGLVAVNPTAHALTLASSLAGQPARRMVPVGGGALNGSADTRGWGL